MSKEPKPTTIFHAFNSMCDRIETMASVLRDPYRRIADNQRLALKRSCEAIEEEWLLDESLRSPRNGY